MDAPLRQGGGDFQTDEPSSDEDRSLAPLRLDRDRSRVVECPEVVDARQVAARNLEPNGPPTGGDQGFLEDDAITVCEHRRLLREVEPLDRDIPDELDTLVMEVLFGVKEEGLARLLATQELLGQRRTVVGDVGFLTDQRKRTLGICLAELLDRLARGQTAPHEEVSCRFHRPLESLAAIGFRPLPRIELSGDNVRAEPRGAPGGLTTA